MASSSMEVSHLPRVTSQMPGRDQLRSEVRPPGPPNPQTSLSPRSDIRACQLLYKRGILSEVRPWRIEDVVEQVVRLKAEGRSRPQIAAALGISKSSVHNALVIWRLRNEQGSTDSPSQDHGRQDGDGGSVAGPSSE